MKRKIYLYMILAAACSAALVAVLLLAVGGSAGAALAVVCTAVFILLACALAARILTKKITAPFSKPDLSRENNPFPELDPFIQRTDAQRLLLDEQLSQVNRERVLIDTISNTMNEGLLLTDRRGHVLSANRSVRAILRIGDTYMGRPIIELVRNIEILGHIETAQAGTASTATIAFGSTIYHVIFNPTQDGILIFFLDVTEKAEAEKRRREFSANVSHELKTPLTSISGYAELIENGMVASADIPEAAGKIRLQAARLIELINDIIRLSELDEANTPVVLSGLDLYETARAAANGLSQKAGELGVTVNVSGEATPVRANSEMLFEVLYNLIDNAVKYNKPGGSVDVGIAKTAQTARITVSDTGIGIPEEDLDRIFERFYRADKSRSKKIDGTGLGLSIVKHIVAQHRGEIAVESRVGAGTKITVELPVGE